jgi:hydrogenase expression/formation protein HypC
MCLGIPGQIIEIVDADLLVAKVDIGGVKRDVIITCVVDDEHPVESCIGAWVLVHAGFAMSRLDEAEAARTLAFLSALGDMDAELDAIRNIAEALEHSA